jgi:hypothetical protein
MNTKVMQRYLLLIIGVIVWSLTLSPVLAEVISHQTITEAVVDSSTQMSSREIEVWVDDDFNQSTPGWGVDHFDTIQNGTNNVSDGGTVYVYDGVYEPFIVEQRNSILLTTVVDDTPVVEGSQPAWDGTLDTPAFVNCVVFVNNSNDIFLYGFDVQGLGLSGRSYALYYNGSSGTIEECTVSPNEHGNMNSLGIRAQWDSHVDVMNCTIENYGRIGIYCRTGTTMTIQCNTIIGQIYTDLDGDYVSYGIEVEDLTSASHAVITGNEIYNHDHTGTPTWSSAGIIIDAWRYYEVTEENCTALIESNEIHDNMIGVQIVPNDDIILNKNLFYDNTEYGAVSDPYWNGDTYVDYDLTAINNWWGDETGPYHPDTNPDGLGDNITDFVIFDPFVEDLRPNVTIVRPEELFLYINIADIFEVKLPFLTNLIIGKLEVEAETTCCLNGIDHVDFLLDDEIVYSDSTEPYSWMWESQEGIFLYNLKVVAYDLLGNSDDQDIQVWRIYLGIL